MTYFGKAWKNLIASAAELDLAPHGPKIGQWVTYVQFQGYQKRLHGDLLNKKIVDTYCTTRGNYTVKNLFKYLTFEYWFTFYDDYDLDITIPLTPSHSYHLKITFPNYCPAVFLYFFIVALICFLARFYS